MTGLLQPERRALQRCSTEWLPLVLLIDRERGQSPEAAFHTLRGLVFRGLVEERIDPHEFGNGPLMLDELQFRVTDAGIMAAMRCSPPVEEAA